jgi:RNA-directed DNA polymerase
MQCDEDCRTARFGKTERPVGWEGDGELSRVKLVRHCERGKPAGTDRLHLRALSHSFTLDCNVYVQSWRAGERVMKSISGFITNQLKLKVNVEKSAVARPWARKFLGFSFTSGTKPKRRIAPQALNRFRERVRELTQRTRGINLKEMIEELASYLKGWRGYFAFSETSTVLQRLDQWIRRRLRCFVWKQWKTGHRRYVELRKWDVGDKLAAQTAGSNQGPWHISMSPALSIALSDAYFDAIGLPRLSDKRRA